MSARERSDTDRLKESILPPIVVEPDIPRSVNGSHSGAIGTVVQFNGLVELRPELQRTVHLNLLSGKQQKCFS